MNENDNMIIMNEVKIPVITIEDSSDDDNSRPTTSAYTGVCTILPK